MPGTGSAIKEGRKKGIELHCGFPKYSYSLFKFKYLNRFHPLTNTHTIHRRQHPVTWKHAYDYMETSPNTHTKNKTTYLYSDEITIFKSRVKCVTC